MAKRIYDPRKHYIREKMGKNVNLRLSMMVPEHSICYSNYIEKFPLEYIGDCVNLGLDC